MEQKKRTEIASLGQFGLIDRLTAPFTPHNASTRMGVGDDAADVFYDMTGEDFPLQAMHAGVECGEFAEKNESMYIISTGISGGSNGHTTAESMNFDLVEEGVAFLVALAERLTQE